MTAKLLASCLLLVAGAAGQQNPTVELNGGLEAQLLTLGRDARSILTAAVRITNKGQDHVFLLFIGPPSAVDNAGGVFDFQSVNGVAFCRGTQNPPSTRVCIGKPMDEKYLSPLQGYTEIEPGKSIRVNIVMRAAYGSKGEQVSLSAEIAYRLVKDADLAKDADVPDQQKLKALRIGTMSFEPVAVNQVKSAF
jgi:hypothetical protein